LDSPPFFLKIFYQKFWAKSNFLTIKKFFGKILVKKKTRWDKSIMRAENITRRVDSLGRIVLPKNLRLRAGIAESDELEVFTTE